MKKGGLGSYFDLVNVKICFELYCSGVPRVPEILVVGQSNDFFLKRN
jgi:hypothetical protein